MAARVSGAAQRWELRRLRAALRHEQQSIEMALASTLHHSADKTTRAQHDAPRGQKNAGTEYYELSDDDVGSTGPGSAAPTIVSLVEVIEQTVDIPVPLSSGFGGLQGLHPDTGSAACFPDPHGDACQGFFRTFPWREKRCEGQPAGGCRSRRELQLIHDGFSCR